DLGVEQDDGVGRVVVPDVVVRLLEVPAVFPGRGVDGDDGRGEEVVAGTDGAVELRPGVAGGEVQQAQFRIHRRRLPHRTAAVLPDIAVRGPGFAAELTRRRNGIKGPDLFPGVRVIGAQASAYALVAAGEAADDHAFVVQRRAGDA